MSTVNPKILELASQGLTVEDISEALLIDKNEVEKALANAMENKNESPEELLEAAKPLAIKELTNIIKLSDNDAAKVAAARVILQAPAALSFGAYKDLEDKFLQMRKVVNRRKVIVEMPKNKDNSSVIGETVMLAN